ncbi:MAG: redox-sensing transcriptional repressor Rex [Chloroflexi bacterium]|nr:redox-sensing transcriptional repressor Rex [Chloroflexota bacterium]
MDVPEVVVQRLPLYVRVLNALLQQDVEVVSSQELGSRLQMTAAQIRKDLSYFGRFGKQGRGYNVSYLLSELRQILGLNREWNAAVIGIGRLGRAIISYPGFAPEGFRVVAAFDSDPRQVEQVVGGLIVRPISELESALRALDVRIGIVAVPADHAQAVIDLLVKCGVGAILNYAPIAPRVPNGVKARNIDPVLALQSMTYYLRQGRASAGKETLPRGAGRA